MDIRIVGSIMCRLTTVYDVRSSNVDFVLLYSFVFKQSFSSYSSYWFLWKLDM